MSLSIWSPTYTTSDSNWSTYSFDVEYFCPTKSKCSMCIWDHTQTTLFCRGKFPKKLADDQCSSITRGSIFYIKYVYIQPFRMGVDWPEIWCLMKYLLCFIFAHTAFLLCGADLMEDTNRMISLVADLC